MPSGLLIRGGNILEEASHIKAIVFDKTGTLTEGQPTVQSITRATPDVTDGQLLAYAAALERESSHPLANAILKAAETLGEAENFEIAEGPHIAARCFESPYLEFVSDVS